VAELPHQQLEDEISAFKHLPHTAAIRKWRMAMQALMDAFCRLEFQYQVPAYSRN